MSATCRLRVVHAGPHVSVQDEGRPGHRRFGVPASGPMDPAAFAAANLAVDNDLDAAGIEVSAGGLTLELVDGPLTVAVTGGGFTVDGPDPSQRGGQVVTVSSGGRIVVTSATGGGWACLAVAGELVAPRWLGSAATHSMSGLGGGAITTGAELIVREAGIRPERDGEIPSRRMRARSEAEPVELRVVVGPQDHRFELAALELFRSTTFTITSAFDRMGVRLDGPPLALRSALSIPSEPVVRGSVQVDGEGTASIVLADHQTTGGYPKIATVISADHGTLAQLPPGTPIRFVAVTLADAIAAARREAEEVGVYLASVAGDDRTLAQRLRRHNIIGHATE